jgi:hypothetical protein
VNEIASEQIGLGSQVQVEPDSLTL